MSNESTLGAWLAAARRATTRMSWAPPLLLRIVVGTSFALAGWGKLGNLDAVTGYFRELGIPAPELQAPLVAGIELASGLAIVLGLATRIAAALLAGVMAVAIATAIWPAGGFADPIASVKTVVSSLEAIYLATTLYLTVHGAGAVSVDHLAARRFPALRIQPQE